jgi:hypothetical protein
LVVDFDAAGSSDPDGSIETYAWTFGNGETGFGPTVRTTYPMPGMYVARLVVTDDDGATDSEDVAIEVLPGGTLIGPEGGAVASLDGRARVQIPAGALTQSTAISVTAVSTPPRGVLAGTAVALHPTGLTFEAPVELRIDYDESALPAGLPPTALTVVTLSNGIHWREVVGGSVDAAAGRVTVELQHFSTYGLTIGRFGAELSGDAVVPPSGSQAAGRALFAVDTSANVLTYRVDTQNLEGTEQSAAIHGPAASGVDGPVLTPIPTGSPRVGTWTYDESIEADLLAGRTYVNVATSAFPNGELRGQIEPLGPAGATAPLTVRLRLWNDLDGGPLMPQVPPSVDRLEVEVSGTGMPSLTQSVTVAPVPFDVTLDVPKGLARRVDVRSYSASNALLYRSTSFVDLAGPTLIQPVGTRAIDTTAPSFAGLTTARRVGADAVELGWNPATDDFASRGEIAYLVFVAETFPDLDVSMPGHAATAGRTRITVDGLAPGQDHHFVVRAMDPAGNVDANTAEIIVSPTSDGTGLWVDAGRGSDSASCGAVGEPCRTITQALTLTAGDEAIYIARGVYDAALGETFPLQLKDGTSLVGDLAFVQTTPTPAQGALRGTLVPTTVVRSDSAIQVIMGAPSAHVGGLFIEERINSNVATIDADGHDLSVAWCVVAGPGTSSLLVNGVELGPGGALRDSVLRDLTGYGVSGYGTDVLVFRNHIRRVSSGIGVVGTKWTVSRNFVADSLFGIGVASPTGDAESGLVFGNTLRDNYGGLAIEGTWGALVERNSITGTETAAISVYGQDAPDPMSTIIRANRISENGGGIVIWSDSKPVVRGNVIACNRAWDLGTWGSQLIDARDNWWDHDPPTWCDDAESNLAGCEPEGVDVCFAATYAGTPWPLLDPAAGATGCGSTGVVLGP